MWEVLVRTPLGRHSLRKFILLCATILVAVFGYALVASTPVFAASATWENDAIIYNDHTYEGPKTATQNDRTGLEPGLTYYEWQDTNNRKVYVIYFAPGTDPPTAEQATLIEFRTNGTALNGPLSEMKIDITPQGDAESEDAGAPSEGTTSCAVEGVGWIICPITKFLAKGMDWIYSLVDGFLEVRTLSTDFDQPMYRAWSFMRDFANILFVIGFLILVYAQVSGGMLDNYTIKRTLPRIIIAAVLVNLSYWICAIAIDVFNILGYGAQDIFIQARNTLVGSEGNSWDVISWERFGDLILSGGTILGGLSIATYLGVTSATAAVAGTSSVAAAAGGLIILLLPALIGLLFVVMVVFLILAARQALITVLVIIAPLAFVAYLLPNTEKWFERWQKTFGTLLFVFPAFSVIFGGSQFASAVIIQNANSLGIILLGMVVQLAPLAITPLLLKLGGGVMARIGGMINNPTKGVFDRGKNWARERSEANKSRGLANLAERSKRMGYTGRRPGRSNRPTRRGRFAENMSNRLNPYNATYAREYNRRQREGMKAANDAMTEGLFGQTAAGQQIYGRNKDAGLEKHFGEASNARRYNTAMATGASAQDVYRRHLHHQSHTDEGISKIWEDQLNADSELHFRQEVEASRALTRAIKDTHHAKKMAEEFETIVQKAAEKSWSDRIRNDDDTRTLHLKAVRNTDGANVAEQKVTGFVENIKAVGDAAPGLASVDDRKLAQQIKDLRRDTEIESEIQTSAKYKQQADLVNALKDDKTLRVRAAGVDEHGEVRVLASAKKAVSDELIKATNNIYDTMDYDLASNPAKMKAAWNDAKDRGEISEIIAYGRKLAMNAPGLRTLKPLLEEFTRGKDPLSDDVMLLKEVLGADSTFRDAGRDLEVWANNETNPATNKPYADFADVRNAAAPWANITASRFARMNAYSQEEALYWLQQNAPDNLQALLEGIGDSNSQTWRDLKGSTRDKIKDIRDGRQIANPNGPIP